MKLLFYISLLILLFGACETTSNDPSFPLIPNIRILSISHDTLIEFADSLIITIEYEDGDGDLGTSDPDVNAIFVKDARLENADEYYLPPLAPEDASISITGNIDLILRPTFILGNANQEVTNFSIFWRDRAGNESNLVETGEVLIVRD